MTMRHLLPLLAWAASSTIAAPVPFLEQHCYDCHDADEKKGGLDLTSFALKLDDLANFETWVKVHDAIANGEMPPKKKARPPGAETKALLEDLDAKLVAADKARIAKDGGRAVSRRLTRAEYENALRDLLALPHLEIKELLPADGSRHGFDKVGEALDLSHVQLAKYLEAATGSKAAAVPDGFVQVAREPQARQRGAAKGRSARSVLACRDGEARRGR